MADPVDRRIVGAVAGVIVVGPLVLAILLANEGLFVPSTSWNAWWPRAAAVVALVPFAAVLAMQWWLFERPVARRSGLGARAVGRVGVAFAAILLPAWAIAVVNGVGRPLLDHPTSARLEATVRFVRYYVDTAGRGTEYYAYVDHDVHGRLRMRTQRLFADQIPEPGTALKLLGHRSWLGDTYDAVELPLETSAVAMAAAFRDRASGALNSAKNSPALRDTGNRA